MRAGRKRKAGPRYPCGQRKLSQEELDRRMTPRKPETVDPTPEVIARRLAAFGDLKAEAELCCPVDLLRRKLSEQQYWAGRYARTVYARYCIAIGAPRVVAGQFRDYVQGAGNSSMGEDQAKAAVKAYQEMILAVSRYSRRSLKEVERVAHGSMPRSVDTLKVGLQALADYLGFEARSVA